MRTIGIAATVALAAALVASPLVNAASDPVKSGTVKLKFNKSFKKQLKKNGVKVKPKSLGVTGGTLDPTTGAASLNLKKLTFKGNGHKLKFKSLKLTLGAGSTYVPGNGKIKGKAKGKKVTVFTTKGGSIARDGFGAKISGLKLKFTKKAAKKVNKALHLSSLHKGSAGKATVSEQPTTTTLISGTATLVGNASTLGKFVSRGVGIPAGFQAIPPATEDLSTRTFTFPNITGNVAPDGSTGLFTSQGGVKIQKTAARGPSCDTNHPVGVFIQFTEAQVNTETKQLSAVVTLPDAAGGNIGRVNIAEMPGMVFGADPSARSYSVSGAATITQTSADTLNLLFGTAAEGCDPGTTGDFAAGDPLGDVSVTANAQ